MKSKFIMLSVVLFSAVVVGQTPQEQALSFFHQAKHELQEGKLQRATELANKARELHVADGIVETNVHRIFEPIRVGRKRDFVERVESEKHPYSPNQLLIEIEQVRQAQKAQAFLVKKRQQPPKLRIESIVFNDEDGNGVLSAYEKVLLRFKLSNVGAHVAENVTVYLDTASLHLQGIESRFQTVEIKPGKSVEFNTHFQMPNQVESSSSAIWLSANEKDGLGDITQQQFDFKSRPYFSPVLAVELIKQHSSIIAPSQPATLRYRITNQGKETAWDVELALDFAQAGQVRILNDIDLAKIRQLRVGESRDITFTLEPDNDLGPGSLLGLSLITQSRNQKQQYIDLALVLEEGRHVNQPFSNQLLARRVELNNQVAVINEHVVGLVINALADAKPGQLNNNNLAKKILQWGVGVPESQLYQQRVTTVQTWSTFAKQQLIKLLTPQHTLHLYVDAQGAWDPQTNQALLGFSNNLGQVQYLALDTWLAELNELPVKQVVVYLEAAFIPLDLGLSPAYVTQALSANFNKVIVLSAAGKNAQALADQYSGSGIFTAMLAQAFSFAADGNHDGLLSHNEVLNYLQRKMPQVSNAIYEQTQLGEFSAVTSTIFSQKL